MYNNTCREFGILLISLSQVELEYVVNVRIAGIIWAPYSFVYRREVETQIYKKVKLMARWFCVTHSYHLLCPVAFNVADPGHTVW